VSLTIENLKIFCDVVGQRSFSRGADLNQVTQSAASQAISHIEKRLGAQLIDRSKRPFVLTPEGRLYYEGCRDLVEKYFEVEARTQSLHQDAEENVSVASVYSINLDEMIRCENEFHLRHPEGRIRVNYLHPEHVYDRVINGENDLGLITFPRPLQDLEVEPWRLEPMVVICCPRHRLAGRRQVPISELEGEDYVALESAIDTRRHIDRFLKSQGVEVNVVMAFDNLEAVKRGVEASFGLSLVPEPAVLRELNNGTLHAAKLEGTDFCRPLSIIYRKDKSVTPAMRTFIELLREGDQQYLDKRISGRPGRRGPCAVRPEENTKVGVAER
jgi:DNA-binding transcriptional LysR family regulator